MSTPWIKIGIGIGISTVTAAAAGLHFYYWYKNKLLQIPPEEWKHIGTLEEITIFPIKSCTGITLDSAQCNVLGLTREMFIDRTFALLDDTGRILTARGYPKMLKIKTKIFKNLLTVTAPEMEDLEINLETIEKNDMQKISVCGSDALVTKCGTFYDTWFSKFILGQNDGVLLVHYKFLEPTKPILNDLKTDQFLKTDTGSLHDASSYMIINQKSIDDLNTRIKDKVTHRHFRPNFLVNTNRPAYDEDKWNWIRIGNDAIFQAVVPTYRCVFTNINPETAERHPDGEPLKTLKSYRVWGKNKSPRMGIQLGIRNTGVVKKGDDVYIG